MKNIILNNFNDGKYVSSVAVMKVFEERILGYVCLPLFVVYKHPKDFKDKYVVRLHKIDREVGKVMPTPYCVIKDTLEEARQALPKNLYRFGRESSDDPVIIETYI